MSFDILPLQRIITLLLQITHKRGTLKQSPNINFPNEQRRIICFFELHFTLTILDNLENNYKISTKKKKKTRDRTY